MKASDLMLIRSHYNKYSIQYNTDTIEPTHIATEEQNAKQ